VVLESMVLRKIYGVGEYGAEEHIGWSSMVQRKVDGVGKYGAEEDIWCWKIWC
jgi:hypothetical protein